MTTFKNNDFVIPIFSHWCDFWGIDVKSSISTPSSNCSLSLSSSVSPSLSSLRAAFMHYRKQETSRLMLFVFFLFVAILSLLWAERVISHYPYTNLTIPLVVIFCTVDAMILFVSFMEFWKYRRSHQRAIIYPSTIDNEYDQDNQLEPRTCWHSTSQMLETLLFFMVCFCGDLYALKLVFLREEYGYVAEQIPNQHFLPEGIVILTMFLPAILYLVFTPVQFNHVVLVICVSFLVHFICVIHYSLSSSLSPIIFAFVLSMFLISEYHRQVWNSFLVNHCLQLTMAENTRMAEEIKSNELRHMIGNVAHDLKTPLSAFISGMEVIQMLSSELLEEVATMPSNNSHVSGGKDDVVLQQSLSSNQVPNSHHVANEQSSSIGNSIKDKLTTILEVAENVTNTNAFMIMTINRCIDYNKTLFGLKLAPKLEVFLLKNGIDFSLACLKTLHDRITITCHYDQDSLKEGNVMLKTDRQWLQENLLCLLGNAVKYSPRGTTVKLVVTVVNSSDLMKKVSSTSSLFHKMHSTMTITTNNDNNEKSISHHPIVSSSVNRDHSLDSLERGRSKLPCMVASPIGSVVGDLLPPSTTSYLKFIVIDSGPGIARQFRHKLFSEPVQAARINGGTGLGLFSLAKRVESLGGDCGINSRVDGQSGSQFWFMIPFEEVVADSDDVARLSTPEAHHGLPPSSFKAIFDQTVSIFSSRKGKPSGSSKSSTSAQSSSAKASMLCDMKPFVALSVDERLPYVKQETGSSRHGTVHNQCPIHSSINGDHDTHMTVRKDLIASPPQLLSVLTTNTVNETSTTAEISTITENAENVAKVFSLLPTSIARPPPQQHQSTVVATKGEKDSTAESSPKPLHILVVDDSPAIVKMTALALRKQGYLVSTAENGLVAFDKVKMMMSLCSSSSTTLANSDNPQERPRIDVILMDFQMPIMDGLTAIRAIKQLEADLLTKQDIDIMKCKSPRKLKLIPPHLSMMLAPIIIGFSAKSDEAQIDTAYSYGMDGFLPKPFTIGAFESILSVCLNDSNTFNSSAIGNSSQPSQCKL